MGPSLGGPPSTHELLGDKPTSPGVAVHLTASVEYKDSLIKAEVKEEVKEETQEEIWEGETKREQFKEEVKEEVKSAKKKLRMSARMEQ